MDGLIHFLRLQRVSPLPFYHGLLGVPWSLDYRPSRGQMTFQRPPSFPSAVPAGSLWQLKESEGEAGSLPSSLFHFVSCCAGPQRAGWVYSRAEKTQNVPRLHLSAPFVGQTSLSTDQQAGGRFLPHLSLPCISWQHWTGAA